MYQVETLWDEWHDAPYEAPREKIVPYGGPLRPFAYSIDELFPEQTLPCDKQNLMVIPGEWYMDQLE